jgi:hypothetical protein
MKQSRSMLLRQLGDQRLFLRTSATGFDAGYRAEAKRLAVSVRVLLYDQSRSPSLLTQLDLRDVIRYTDTSPEPPAANEVRTHGYSLVAVRMTAQAIHYVPPLGSDPGRMVRLSDISTWWSGSALEDIPGHVMTRESIIKAVSNWDGGAHVSDLPQWYVQLTRGASLGHSSSAGPLIGWQFAATRQIAFELTTTLDRELPRLLAPEEEQLTHPQREISRFDETPALFVSGGAALHLPPADQV